MGCCGGADLAKMISENPQIMGKFKMRIYRIFMRLRR